MPRRSPPSGLGARTTFTPLILIALLVGVGAGPLACGLEPDGSHKATSSSSASETGSAGDQLGRYRTESIRLGVTRPLFILVDTATGLVLNRPILGSQKFTQVGTDPAPGASHDPKVTGRYDVKVVPGRRGAGLLRLDTVSGMTWFYQLSANQSAWTPLPSELDDLTEKTAEGAGAEASGGASSASASGALAVGGAAPAKIPPIQPMIEVLTEPGYEPELRVWTADHMASIYPAEAAELLSGKLQSSDPKILLAIINKVSLDSSGRVRTALEKLQSHENADVAAAVAARLK